MYTHYRTAGGDGRGYGAVSSHVQSVATHPSCSPTSSISIVGVTRYVKSNIPDSQIESAPNFPSPPAQLISCRTLFPLNHASYTPRSTLSWCNTSINTASGRVVRSTSPSHLSENTYEQVSVFYHVSSPGLVLSCHHAKACSFPNTSHPNPPASFTTGWPHTHTLQFIPLNWRER